MSRIAITWRVRFAMLRSPAARRYVEAVNAPWPDEVTT